MTASAIPRMTREQLEQEQIRLDQEEAAKEKAKQDFEFAERSRLMKVNAVKAMRTITRVDLMNPVDLYSDRNNTTSIRLSDASKPGIAPGGGRVVGGIKMTAGEHTGPGMFVEWWEDVERQPRKYFSRFIAAVNIKETHFDCDPDHYVSSKKGQPNDPLQEGKDPNAGK